MSELKHMPGPWEILRGAEDSQGSLLIVSNHDTFEGEDAWRVASVTNHCGDKEDTAGANARLIAASPDLLAACQWIGNIILTASDGGAAWCALREQPGAKEWADGLRDALAKTTGETP